MNIRNAIRATVGRLKICGKCNDPKDESEYHRDKQTKDGLCAWCIECRKKIKRKHYIRHAPEIRTKVRIWRKQNPEAARDLRYRMEVGEFDGMLLLQQNRCPICLVPFDENNRPHVDHNHKCCSGKNTCGECVRGLLCHFCNKGLGHFRDNTDYLIRAVAYLKDR